MISPTLNSHTWPSNANEAAMPTPPELLTIETEPPVDRDVAAAQRRVKQLERLNATLAAELDRCRPVVDAAIRWIHSTTATTAISTALSVKQSVDTYERGKGNG